MQYNLQIVCLPLIALIPFFLGGNYKKGATVFVLQKDKNSQPIYVVWGIPKSYENPAVLIIVHIVRPVPTIEETIKKSCQTSQLGVPFT